MKILHVVGARPNFMKAAPVMSALPARNSITQVLVHTGQHYDANMSELFFEQLGLPEPDVNLHVGSGSHAMQTAQIIIRLEDVLVERKPDLVIVVGDVNSTLACALAASKIDYSKELGANSKVDTIKGEQLSVSNLTNLKNSINAMNARGNRPLIAHVEAGLRSFDRTMPEEINRLLTDQISDFLFTPSPDANENLKEEGIPEEKIFLVGNVMVDSLLFNLEIPNYRCLALTPIKRLISLLKTYYRYLTHEDRLRCQIETEKGKVRKFVIQYEIFAEGGWAAVTRFDTFHDAVHRDLVSPDGTVTKRWYLQLNFDEGLTFAYNDIETNWEKYREWYLSKVGR